MRSIKTIFFEAKPKGRKVRSKKDVAALTEFTGVVSRLKSLLKAKREYERLARQIKSGKHGAEQVLEIMRKHYEKAFMDMGDAYDDTMEAVLRLEDVALRMNSKKYEQAGAARVLEILKTQATPAVKKAIAKAEEAAQESKKVTYWYDWELVEATQRYGYLTEGIMDWLKEVGTSFLKRIKGWTKFFESIAPRLNDIATQIESELGQDDFF